MAPNSKTKDYNLVVDPMTRIEGHLRIQATAVPVRNHGRNHDDQGHDGRDRSPGYLITEPGLSSSTMVRGFEIIMRNRDPREAWAFAQRICGVCTVVHGLTSVRAVENAVGLKVSKNADLIRNLMIGAQYVHDHVMHFYHLHALDWVDVVSALDANVVKTAVLARTNNPAYYANVTDQGLLDILNGVLAKLNDLVARGQLGLFGNGYWGHPAYLLSPEQNLLLVSHYLDALDWAPDIVLVHAVFGGKDPHPDLLVGGMQYPFSSTDFTDIDAASGLPKWRAIIENSISKMRHFVDTVYIPDVALAASVYKDWANYGATAGNFLCFGEFPDPNLVRREFVDGAIDYTDGYLIPQGVIWNKKMTEVKKFDERKVSENVAHAWYTYTSGVDLHPYKGETELHYDGPVPDQPNYMLDERRKYSWMKSPRYDGKPVEVGPLAHVLMMYAKAKKKPATPAERGHKLAKDLVDAIWIKQLRLPYEKLNSTLGRIFCRALETKVIGDNMLEWQNALVNNLSGPYYNPATEARLKTPAEWPKNYNSADHSGSAFGFGFTEAPRGALGHWVKIDPLSFKIANYQCIVASLWNAGPRDADGVPGPYEKSLEGHYIYDPEQPLEVLRTIHSFDPCIGCAVHIVNSDGEPLVQVSVNHMSGPKLQAAG